MKIVLVTFLLSNYYIFTHGTNSSPSLSNIILNPENRILYKELSTPSGQPRSEKQEDDLLEWPLRDNAAAIMIKRKPFSMNYLDSLGPANPKSWQNTISRTRPSNSNADEFQKKRSFDNAIRKNSYHRKSFNTVLIESTVMKIEKSLNRLWHENERLYGKGSERRLCMDPNWIDLNFMKKFLLLNSAFQQSQSNYFMPKSVTNNDVDCS